MKTAFPNQFMVDLLRRGKNGSLPNFLREMTKQLDISNYDKLAEFLTSELANAPLQNQETVDYFLFLSNQALQFNLYRGDYEGFYQVLEILRHRLTSLKNAQQSDVNAEAWSQYLDLAEVAFKRLLRHISIESYEAIIDKLDWSAFDKAFIPTVSRTIGYVYLMEEDADQAGKSRLWLQKSIHESSFEQNLANYVFFASYYLGSKRAEDAARLNQILTSLRTGTDELEDGPMRDVFDGAILELEASIMRSQFARFDDNLTKLEHCQQQIRELEDDLDRFPHMPAYLRASLESTAAHLYVEVFGMTQDSLEQESFAAHAMRHIDEAIQLAEETRDEVLQTLYRLEKCKLAVATGQSFTEKESKEIIQSVKKTSHHPRYIEAVAAYIQLLIRNDVSHKTYDVLLDAIKYGTKSLEQGGFYLLVKSFSLANDVFLRETHQPGVSWMIHLLHEFFERVKNMVQVADEHFDEIGADLLDAFRREYQRFEPVSNFNIKTYFMYQLFEIRILRLGARMHGDELSLSMADRLSRELENPNNPLSFMQTNWDEFKNVPNFVRNNTLNKCISISKGDLPLAADHLDFSYRNLRSYITFKEVNRLGFFLDMQQTENRQLEQGIRYMFFDLYKNGTIFEVVFDMPKFLVKYAKKGFYSQDLEQELNIKGTTAKKYIKIMMEIGLIRQDKTTGRKHYYRLIRENVMKRLGKDQNTLIEPQQDY